MTFTQWLQWWTTSPSSLDQRTRMISDDQYFALLDACTPGVSIKNMDVSDDMKRWLYYRRATHNYTVVTMVYHRGGGNSSQFGPVLVYSGHAGKKGQVADNINKRVIAASQFGLALHHVHESSTGHRGQEATTSSVFSVYHGIPRVVIREYVSRCSVCQQKRAKQYKPTLQPITTKAMFERFLIDLIDFNNIPDGAFRYIVHMADHRTPISLGCRY
jgi:hypothetical protein